MKKVISISAVPLILLSLYFARLRQAPSSVHAAEAQRAAFLIRFGVDGKADVDWSGSIDPPPSRMIGWQFDSGDEITGAGWKCATAEQNYWDTPYERRMQPTSNRDKVTVKGIVVEFDASKRGDVRVSTGLGQFHISGGRFTVARSTIIPERARGSARGAAGQFSSAEANGFRRLSFADRGQRRDHLDGLSIPLDGRPDSGAAAGSWR